MYLGIFLYILHTHVSEFLESATVINSLDCRHRGGSGCNPKASWSVFTNQQGHGRSAALHNHPSGDKSGACSLCFVLVLTIPGAVRSFWWWKYCEPRWWPGEPFTLACLFLASRPSYFQSTLMHTTHRLAAPLRGSEAMWLPYVVHIYLLSHKIPLQRCCSYWAFWLLKIKFKKPCSTWWVRVALSEIQMRNVFFLRWLFFHSLDFEVEAHSTVLQYHRL